MPQSPYYLRNTGASHQSDRFILKAPVTHLWAFRTSILAPYRDEYEFAMAPGWDGPGTVILSAKVLKIAEQLVESYATLDQLVEVGASRTGSISFIWSDNDQKYIYLDVGPNETVHLYSDVTGEKWEGISVASDPRILRKIAGAFVRAGWYPQKIIRFAVAGDTSASTAGRRWAIA